MTSDPSAAGSSAAASSAISAPAALPGPARVRERLGAVVAIPVTPFTPASDVDWDGHALLIRRLVEHGVDVVTPNGNTGEFYTLSEAEKRRPGGPAGAGAAGRAGGA